MDPFFAALRERRPDIDIVILPPAGPAEPLPEATPDDLIRSARLVDATFAALAARLPDPTSDGPRWEAYNRENVRRWAQLEARTPEGGAMLTDLGQAFRDAKWRSTVEVRAFHRWTASQPGAEIVGTWSERHHGLVVTLTGRVLRPTADVMEALT